MCLDDAIVPESEAKIAASDRGLLFGRGVFETFRSIRGRPIFRFDRHIARMQAGAGALGISAPPTLAHAEDSVGALLERCQFDDARVRMTLTAGAVGAAPSILIQARPATDYPDSLYKAGVPAVIARVRRNETSPLSRIKSLNCLDNILAREEARSAGAVEALLLNTRGVLAEGSASNVFVVCRGELRTPSVGDGALPGITREAVLEFARADGVPAREATVILDELLAADEVFVTNAVACVLPVIAIDGVAIGAGNPGEVTRALGVELRRAILQQPRFTPSRDNPRQS